MKRGDKGYEDFVKRMRLILGEDCLKKGYELAKQRQAEYKRQSYAFFYKLEKGA